MPSCVFSSGRPARVRMQFFVLSYPPLPLALHRSPTQEAPAQHASTPPEPLERVGGLVDLCLVPSPVDVEQGQGRGTTQLAAAAGMV